MHEQLEDGRVTGMAVGMCSCFLTSPVHEFCTHGWAFVSIMVVCAGWSFLGIGLAIPKGGGIICMSKSLSLIFAYGESVG